MIYFYYGENSQERDAAVKLLVDNFIATNGDMAVDSIETEGNELATLIDAVTTTPFLSQRRLVIVRYVSTNKDITAKIDTLLDRIADTTDVLFIESTIDNRSVWSKTLKERADVVTQYELLNIEATTNWVIDQVSQLGGNITHSNAQLLVDRVGNNQQLLKNELKKLLLVSSEISAETIAEMTHITPQSSVFAMLDALMQGKLNQASKLYYEQRTQGMEPQAILGMLAWQLHILAIIVASGNESAEAIAKRAKLNVFVVRKNLVHAKKLPKKTVVDLLDAAIASDMRIKTGKAKPDAEVHALLVQIGAIVKTA